MWTFAERELDDRTREVRPRHDGQAVTWRAAIEAWRTDPAFTDGLGQRIAEAPFEALAFETPALTAARLDDPLELVLVDAPELARLPVDGSPFHEHFTRAAETVACFPNLGADAWLVVPCPLADGSAYGHLAAFERRGPREQRRALWRQVGESLAERVSTAPTWLSTAGGGVAWLHLRLDSRPKYLRHAPYRARP